MTLDCSDLFFFVSNYRKTFHKTLFFNVESMATFSNNFMVSNTNTNTPNMSGNNRSTSPISSISSNTDSPFIEHLQDFEIKLDFNLNTNNTEWNISSTKDTTNTFITKYNNKSNESSQIFSFIPNTESHDKYHNTKKQSVNNKNENEQIVSNILKRVIQTPLKLNSEYDDDINDQNNNDDLKQDIMDNIDDDSCSTSSSAEPSFSSLYSSSSSSLFSLFSNNMNINNKFNGNNNEEIKNGLDSKSSINLTNNSRKHQNLLEIEDKYSILLDSFLRPFQVLLLIPAEIRNLVLLYFRDCTFIYLLNGGKNCGISCISTKHIHDENNKKNINNSCNNFNRNKEVNFKIYDIKTYNKQIKNTPLLTKTFMNEWDLNNMKLCHGKDINISPILIPSYHKFIQNHNRKHFDILFKAQKLPIQNNLYYFNNYKVTGIIMNPLDLLYHDIEKIQRKNKYIRTANNNSYHNSIKTFEIEFSSVADIAGFEMIYSQSHGLLTVGDFSDIQALKIEDNGIPSSHCPMFHETSSSNYSGCTQCDEESQSSSSDDSDNDGHQSRHSIHTTNGHDNLYFNSNFHRYSSFNQPQWRFLTELPTDLKWKTQRTLQILRRSQSFSSLCSEYLFVAGGLNMAINGINNNNPHNNILSTQDIQNRLCSKAAIYNFDKSEWTQISDLNYGRRNGKSYFNNYTNKLFIGGGSEYDRCHIFEVFDTNKYNLNWYKLPSSIYKHEENLSIYQNLSISPSLLYAISKNGAECFDLRSNEWVDLSETSSFNSVTQCIDNKANVSLTI